MRYAVTRMLTVQGSLTVVLSDEYLIFHKPVQKHVLISYFVSMSCHMCSSVLLTDPSLERGLRFCFWS